MKTHYRFTAKNWNGKTVSDSITAANKTEALEMLYKQNLVPLKLREQNPLYSALKKLLFMALHNSGYRPYTNRGLMVFCRQLSTMLRAGISVLQCLEILSEQKEMAPLKKQIIAAKEDIEEGNSLTLALQNRHNAFPAVMISMVEAGETSGRLDSILDKMADHFEKQHDFSEKIRSATLYPVFIMLVSLVVLVVMVLFVLPQFAGTFSAMGIELPLYSRILLSFAAVLSNRWFVLPALSFIGITGIITLSKTSKGRRRIDLIRLRLPFFGRIYTQTIAARFARTLATLVVSGISLHHALSLVDKVVENAVFSESVSALNEALSNGDNLYGAMQKDQYFPTLLTEMVRIGEETGALEQTLHSTALFYEKEVTYIVERLGTTLEPALLLFVGFFIGLLVFAILSPMYRVFEMM